MHKVQGLWVAGNRKEVIGAETPSLKKYRMQFEKSKMAIKTINEK